jgi:hypothetical protein
MQNDKTKEKFKINTKMQNVYTQQLTLRNTCYTINEAVGLAYRAVERADGCARINRSRKCAMPREHTFLFLLKDRYSEIKRGPL